VSADESPSDDPDPLQRVGVIELSASPLPRECSTTELQQRRNCLARSPRPPYSRRPADHHRGWPPIVARIEGEGADALLPSPSHLNASAHASTHQEHALADIEALKLVRRHHLIRLNGDDRDAQ
jgi:hypothetical protein